MANLPEPALCLLAGLLLVAGCGHRAGSTADDAGSDAFKTAPPDIAQTWNRALEASRTNDYVTAQTLLFELLRRETTPAQTAAIQQQIAVSRQHLEAAVQQGDPAALAALQQLRNNPPNRPH